MLTFTYHGAPQTKQRAKAGRTFGGRKVHYTPAATRTFEQAIGWACRAKLGAPCLAGPLGLDLEFGHPVPSSYSAKRTQALVGQPMTGAPDYDNVAKAVGDALNGILWEDDRLIADARVRQVWSLDPYIKITVWQL